MQVPSDFDSEVVGAAVIEELEKMMSPLGTRDNPAVSCLDIALCRGDHFTAGENEIHQWHNQGRGAQGPFSPPKIYNHHTCKCVLTTKLWKTVA